MRYVGATIPYELTVIVLHRHCSVFQWSKGELEENEGEPERACTCIFESKNEWKIERRDGVINEIVSVQEVGGPK